MTDLVRATTSFFVFAGGKPRQIRKNMLLRSDDPAVKGREQYFTTDSDVEQATAAPGEKRAVTRKPKS